MSANRRSLILVLLLWVAGLCAAGQFAKIAVPFTDFRTLYSEAGDSVGWLLSLISFIGAVLGMVAGALVGRFGYRRMLLGGLLLGGLLSLWQSSLPAFPFLAASRILEGASHLAIVVAAPTLIAEASSARYRGPALALWSTFFGVAFVLVAWFGLPFVHTVGIGPLFMTHGILTLAVAVLLALITPKDAPPAGPREAFRLSTLITGLATACRSPRIAAPGAGWLFYTLTYVALLAVLPGRMTVEDREIVLGIVPILGIGLSLTLVPFLLRYIAAGTIVLIGFGLALSAILLASGISMVVMCILLFASLGLVQGGSYASVAELNRSPAARALSFGLMAQTGNIGNLAGTPILLYMLDLGGEGALVHAVAAIYGCALLVLFLLGRRRGKPEEAV